jgi:tetratricopeptide (TPR) repeat protein
MLGGAELANYSLAMGRFGEAERRVLRAYDLQEEAGTRFYEGSRSELEAIATATYHLHFLDDPDGAVSALQRFLKGPPSGGILPADRGYAEIASLLAASGRPDLARERLAAYRADVPEEARAEAENRSRVLTAEAAIALAEGGAEEAVRLLHEARALVRECELCGLVELGEAFEAAAMPDSAAVAFDAYLEAHTLFRSQFDNSRLHRALLGLARSYEALDQPDRAAEYYGRVLNLWSTAEAPLRSRVEGIRARVGALTPR